MGDPFTPYPVHPVYPVENEEIMGMERERFLGLLDAMKLEYSYLEDEDVVVEKKMVINFGVRDNIFWEIFRDLQQR